MFLMRARRPSRGFLVTNVVTRRQIAPLDGARREPEFLENSSDSLLGCLDSNQEQLNQNQPTPIPPDHITPDQRAFHSLANHD